MSPFQRLMEELKLTTMWTRWFPCEFYYSYDGWMMPDREIEMRDFIEVALQNINAMTSD